MENTIKSKRHPWVELAELYKATVLLIFLTIWCTYLLKIERDLEQSDLLSGIFSLISTSMTIIFAWWKFRKIDFYKAPRMTREEKSFAIITFSYASLILIATIYAWLSGVFGRILV